MQEKKSYQILMVTENDVEVKKLERLLATLSLANFQFTQMSPAELSVARYGDRNFDIGIVDLGRGKSPELKIIDYLHRKMPYLPMIILNEQNDVDYSLLALRKGAQDYLVKSQLDAERLIRSMHYAMERMQQTEKLANRISYEPLTGLANRLLLNDRLEQAIKRAERYSTGVAVLYIDIDKFRVIDEKLGRKRANDYLKKTANRIRQCLRNSDTVARVGSDEFIVLLEAMSHTHGAMSVSNKILQSLNQGINIDGKNIKASCSIGIALYPQCGEEINDLICKADITRCRAAREGGNRYCIYTENVDADFLQAINLEDDLVHALDRNEFTLFYQPKFNLNNGRVSGSEALLRWEHPKHGLLLPNEFLHYMEDKEIIHRVGEWILETACETNKRWHEGGLCVGPIAVNIAGKQLLHENFISQVEKVLAKTGLPSCLLELEITENTLIDNVDICIKQLESLRNIGVSIAIDDFGTGYCSFNYLRNFLIDTIKIDRSFIEHINKSGPESAITMAIVRLARDIQVNVVAEGVENLDQFRLLYEMAADEIQGNFLSPAMSANSMRNYLMTNGLEMNLLLETDLRMAV